MYNSWQRREMETMPSYVEIETEKTRVRAKCRSIFYERPWKCSLKLLQIRKCCFKNFHIISINISLSSLFFHFLALCSSATWPNEMIKNMKRFSPIKIKTKTIHWNDVRKEQRARRMHYTKYALCMPKCTEYFFSLFSR